MSTTQHASMPAPSGVGRFGKPLEGVFGYGVTNSVPSPVLASNQNGWFAVISNCMSTRCL